MVAGFWFFASLNTHINKVFNNCIERQKGVLVLETGKGRQNHD